MFHVVDFDNNTFGDGHKKLEDAVKEYAKRRDTLLAAKGTDFYLSVVEFVFPQREGNPNTAMIVRHVKV